MRATLACALLSLGIELLQLFWIPGRDASLSDLVSNTAGGAAGAAIAPRLETLFSPDPPAARRLLLAGVVAWLALSVLSGWIFRPWAQDEGALTERSDSTRLSDAFAGKLGRVRVSGDSFPTGWLDTPSSDRIRRLFSSETVVIQLEAVSQAPIPDAAWIYRLRIGAGIASVGQLGRSLVLEVPRRVADLKLSGPTLRLDDAVPPRAGVPFRVEAGERGRRLWVESTWNDHASRAELLLAPTMAWALVIPFDYAMGPEAGVVTMLWLGGLMFPLGYWAAFTARPPVALLGVGVAIVVGLGLMSWTGGTGLVPLRDWLAAAAGAAAGWAARASAAYLASRCGSPSASESYSS